jgi:hypothetical protein
MPRNKGIPGLSFSWKRASGLTQLKSQLSRQTGIPLTKAGRQRKVGKLLGCCVPAAFLIVGAGVAAFAVSRVVQALVP